MKHKLSKLSSFINVSRKLYDVSSRFDILVIAKYLMGDSNKFNMKFYCPLCIKKFKEELKPHQCISVVEC